MKTSLFDASASGAICGENAYRIPFTAGEKLPVTVTAETAEPLQNDAWVFFTLSCPTGELYRSGRYAIGREAGKKQWRIPPMLTEDVTAEIHVTVPEGETLSLTEFSFEPQRAYPTWEKLRFNAHLGFMGVAPENTMASVKYAAACGFPACIVVPKVTRDGQFVFIHDDTINRTARDENGNPPPAEMAVADMTLDELQSWDFGVRKNAYYKGTRIPMLADFFTVCAESGMRPMFSTHPALTIAQWHEVRRMLEERKILDLFHVKSFSLDCLKDAYSVFGEEIEGYTWDHGDAEVLAGTVFGKSRRRIGVELQGKAYTKEIADEIRAHRFFAAAYAIGRCGTAEYGKYVRMGVTEFTEDHHCSMGLNW